MEEEELEANEEDTPEPRDTLEQLKNGDGGTQVDLMYQLPVSKWCVCIEGVGEVGNSRNASFFPLSLPLSDSPLAHRRQCWPVEGHVHWPQVHIL